MKNTQWGTTLIVNLIRAACAGIVWAVLMLFLQPKDAPIIQMLLLPVGYLIVLLPMSLICTGLSKVGVPFVGWFPVMLSIILLPGDPPTYFLHKFKPQFVPVEKYNFVNFTTVILVKDQLALS